MCLEDVRIGRASLGESHDATIGTTEAVLVPANPKRFALFFPGLTGATVSVRPYNAGIDATYRPGQIVLGGLWITLRDHGAIVTAQWTALSDTAGTAYWWAESLFYDQHFVRDGKWLNPMR